MYDYSRYHVSSALSLGCSWLCYCTLSVSICGLWRLVSFFSLGSSVLSSVVVVLAPFFPPCFLPSSIPFLLFTVFLLARGGKLDGLMGTPYALHPCTDTLLRSVEAAFISAFLPLPEPGSFPVSSFHVQSPHSLSHSSLPLSADVDN